MLLAVSLHLDRQLACVKRLLEALKICTRGPRAVGKKTLHIGTREKRKIIIVVLDLQC